MTSYLPDQLCLFCSVTAYFAHFCRNVSCDPELKHMTLDSLIIYINLCILIGLFIRDTVNSMYTILNDRKLNKRYKNKVQFNRKDNLYLHLHNGLKNLNK